MPMIMGTDRAGMFDDFVTRAMIAAVAIAVAAGPLGCFVVWRRMAYFGDAAAHAAVLGVALSFAFSISLFVGVLGIVLLMAVLVGVLGKGTQGRDTVLGVMSYGALAFGLVLAFYLGDVRLDLMAYLFGDILAVSKADMVLVVLGCGAVLALVVQRWSGLLTSTLNPDLAAASGIRPQMEQWILTVALALVVAVAIEVVGALLIGALLIIPAAAARPLARTPEVMALMAALIGAGSALGGVGLSVAQDTPAGPSIVCCAAVAFGATHLMRRVLPGV